MKAIELVQINATRQQVREIIVLGTIEFLTDGRQYPWLGTHGCVTIGFHTKAEAVRFASTGEA